MNKSFYRSNKPKTTLQQKLEHKSDKEYTQQHRPLTTKAKTATNKQLQSHKAKNENKAMQAQKQQLSTSQFSRFCRKQNTQAATSSRTALDQLRMEIPSMHKLQVLSYTLKSAFGQHSRSNIPPDCFRIASSVRGLLQCSKSFLCRHKWYTVAPRQSSQASLKAFSL
jgi:hypothetical protein